MKYFKLVMSDAPRWMLRLRRNRDDGTEVDLWEFTKCEPVTSPKPVAVEVSRPGPPLDYNQTALGTVIISKRLGDLLEQIAGGDIQRIPAKIQSEGDWEILNVLRLIECIDHERSVIQYYPHDHKDRPGKPRGVVELVIDVHRAEKAHIFKPKDWTVVDVVSESVVAAWKEAGITGADFWAVSR